MLQNCLLLKLFFCVAIIAGMLNPYGTKCMAQSNFPKMNKADKAVFEQNKLLGKGVNIPSLTKMEAKYFKIIKEAGFDNVRIPLNPFKYTKSETDFTIDTAYFNLVDNIIQQALSNKLMAIVDFHEHHAMGANPLGNKAKFLAIWEQIANRYSSYPRQVLFEICNEPNMKDSIWNNILKEAHQLIRKSNPKRTILIGSIYGNQIKFLKNLVLPENDRNIIVTIHYYMPIQFTHQGASWSEKNRNLSGIEWTNKETEEQAIKNDFDTAQQWSVKYKRPLHLGEFGVYEKAGMDSRIRWTQFVAREAEKRKWSWSYWEFNAGFGIYNMDKGEWKPGLLNALIPVKK